MRIQVKGARGEDPLCPKCLHGTVIRGSRESEEKVYCNYISKFMTANVHECSSYSDKKSISLSHMIDMATIIVPKKNGAIGFMSAQQWRKENPHESVVKTSIDTDW